MQKWPEFFDQVFGQTFGFFIDARAGVPRFSFGQQSPDIENAETEGQPDAAQFAEEKFDREHVVVARGPFVGDLQTDDWKNRAGLLQDEQRMAQMPEKFAARLFQDFEITRVIDMIAERAFSVDDAVLMLKDRSRHALNFRAGMENVEWKECFTLNPRLFPRGSVLFC
jgi:hypothetical protein